MGSEKLVFRDALAWTVIAAGGLFVVDATVPPGPVGQDGGYLVGVWTRSFSNLYQAAILAAVIAVPFHFAWVALRGNEVRAYAYDRFAGWAQTALTSLGFLGTVVGVSLAVGGLEAAMLEEDPRELIRGLSTAFDTTFLGLSGALLLMLARVVMPRRL
jgi:hypothetical protein